MSKVFVVQNQHRWCQLTEKFQPKFDLSAAEKFGTLEYLLSPTAAPFKSEAVIAELKDKLKDFTADDFLLLIGNPALIGFAVAIAAQFAEGHVSLLQWSGKDQRYITINTKNLSISTGDW
jgi:hypothetical protein